MKRTWVMNQTWEHLLFLHWPVSSSTLQKLVPDPLQIDTFAGEAWLGIIVFRMTGIRLKGSPFPYPIPFPEINVRTYVRHEQIPGICFLSLDASDSFVLNIARWWYQLPYHRASMHFHRNGEQIHMTSCRGRAERADAETFNGIYRPHSNPFSAKPNSIEHWLTERYRFFTLHARHRKMCCCEVEHPPWLLQTAEAEIRVNTMTHSLGIKLADKPVFMHYSGGVEAKIAPLLICGKNGPNPVV